MANYHNSKASRKPMMTEHAAAALHQVISQLNTAGCRFLELMKYNCAIETFRLATDTMMLSIRNNVPQDHMQMVLNTLKNIMESEEENVPYSIDASALCVEPFGTLTSTNAAVQGQDRKAFGRDEVATVLFNLAVSIHLKSYVQGMTTRRAEHVLHLYERVFRLTTPDPANASMVNKKHRMNLTLACLNNMGQIYFEEVQYDRSDDCFRQIARACTSQYLRNLDQTLSEQRKSTILLNLQVYMNLSRQAPAA